MALDQPALERAYAALEAPLYNTVYRWVWDAQEAQDLVQEAFLRVWRARERVRPETLKPLLFRTALNLAANRRRARKLWRWLTLDALRAEPSPSPSSDAALDDARRVLSTRAAVDGLPEHLRQVIMLCELAEMSHAEVAQTLDIPIGTVGSRRHAALKRLRAQLLDPTASAAPPSPGAPQDPSP